MRAFVVLLLFAIAVPCYAEDPLESLNTIEDTLSTMERTLKLRGGRGEVSVAALERLPLDDRLFFVSDEALGDRGWVAVRPCTEEVAAAQAAAGEQSCVAQPDGSVAMGGHYWKSRPAAADELRLGMFVVARDESVEWGWFVTRITGLSDLESGFVSVAAPFRVAVKGLRIVE